MAASKKTLITGSQVVKRGPVDKDFPIARVTPYIFSAEFRWLADAEFGMLGPEFYAALVADRRQFIQWESTVLFSAGDVVVYNGLLYEANIGSTGVAPPDATFWDEVSYFVTPAYQSLWDEHLEELIAFAVVHSSLYLNTFQITASGPTQKSSGDNKPASTDGVRLLKDSIKSEIDLMAKRMHQFLILDRTNYPLYIGFKNETCCGDGDNNNNFSGQNNTLGVYISNDSEC
jgi:hypothetical protein